MISNHLVTNKKFGDKQGLICKFTTLLNKNGSRHTNNIIETAQITTEDNEISLGSRTAMTCCNGHNSTISSNRTHFGTNGQKFMNY